MTIVVSPKGKVEFLYQERLSLATLGGNRKIRRASQVEPDYDNQWWADMGPSDGPRLGPFETRSEALEAEEAWLTEQMKEDA